MRRTACFRPSIPTGAVITSTPPRPGSRWTRRASPRWVGRSSNSASSTSRATARRAGGAWSGCSARSRAGAAAPAPAGARLDRGGQPLARHRLHPAPQRPLRGRAAEEGTAFVPFVGALDDILCVQDERVVGNDNTVRYGGRVLQIPEQRHRRLPRWPACDLPRSAPACRLRGERNPNRSDPPRADCCVSPLRSKAWGRRGRALLAPPRPQASTSIRSGHVMCYKCRTSSRALDSDTLGSIR